MKRQFTLAAVFLAAMTVVVGCSRDKDVQVEQAPRETPDTPAVAEKVAVGPRPRTAQEGAILPTSARHELAADVSDATRRATLVEGNTSFALDLHKRLAAKSKGGNVVFSPYSVSAALAMTYVGARGETLKPQKGRTPCPSSTPTRFSSATTPADTPSVRSG